MSPFVTLLTAIKKLLSFKVDRDEFREAVRETKKDIEGVKNAIPTDEKIVAELIEADMLPAVHTSGKVLTDSNGNVILRY